MKIIGKHSSILIVFVCFVSAIFFAGYSCSNSPYKTITVKNELGSYYLEYPSYYEKHIRNNLEFKVPYTHLLLDGPIGKETAEVFDPDTGEIITVVGERGTSSIEIVISNYKLYYGEAYSATDKIESVLEDETKWANFELLERSPRTVAGVEGEMIVYLVDRLMPIPVEDGKNLDYVRAVYFDYNDLTWEITAKCNEDIQDQVKADFEHIVQTFQILE